jgi:hypothetical protein
VVDRGIAADLFAVFTPATVDVVDAQEHGLSFATTGAGAPVRFEHEQPDSLVVLGDGQPGLFAIAREVPRHAFRKDLRATGATPIYVPIFSDFEIRGGLSLFADGAGFSFDFHDSE